MTKALTNRLSKLVLPWREPFRRERTGWRLDFLIEALSEWQKAKDRGDNVPKHDVFISAVSGTSAGGITAALGLGISGGRHPIGRRAFSEF